MELKDLIASFGIFQSRRFYKKEKFRYLQMLGQEMKALGWPTKFIHTEKQVLLEKIPVIHLLSGNLEKADTIIMTNYDTPLNSFSSTQFAFMGQSKKSFVINSLISLAVVIICLSAVLFYFYPRLQADGLISWSGLYFVLAVMVSLYLITRYRSGFPKQNNLIINSSSIISMLLYAKEINSDKVAFAFIDQTLPLEEVLAVMQQLLTHKCQIIHLDAVGSSGNLSVISDSYLDLTDRIDLLGKSETAYADYPAEIMITSGEYEEGKIRVRNQLEDNDMEAFERRLQEAKSLLSQIVE